MPDDDAEAGEVVYEFLTPAGDVGGWIERRGLQVAVVVVDDETDPAEAREVYLGFPADLADDVCEAIQLAARPL